MELSGAGLGGIRPVFLPGGCRLTHATGHAAVQRQRMVVHIPFVERQRS